MLNILTKFDKLKPTNQVHISKYIATKHTYMFINERNRDNGSLYFNESHVGILIKHIELMVFHN